MTMPMHFENLLPSILDTTVEAFKSGAKDIANNLLMNLIFSLKEQNNELKNMIFDLEQNPQLSFTLDTEEFQDIMISLEDMLEKLLSVSTKNKHNSEIFMELHKICDEMLSNIIVLGNEVSAVASELRYKEQQIAS